MIKDYIFSKTGIVITDEIEKTFEAYYDFMMKENKKYNLTTITNHDSVWIKHFADSILGSVIIPQNATVCDIGSGAGFPSLPLKIVRPDISVTLVDARQKRIEFTKMLCKELGIEAEHYHDRVEDFAPLHSEQFDVVTARALAPLPILLEYTAQLARVGGCVLAYKANVAETKTANNACQVLGLEESRISHFQLPDGSKRCFFVYRKMKHTPPTYPRGMNKPRTNPL